MARSKKCTYEGLDFDSLTERDYYKCLQEKQANGEIFSLEIQKNFLLQEGFRMDDGAKIQEISYTCDQYYIDKNGRVNITDVKGSEFTITEPFRLRFKMLKNLHRDWIYHVVIRYDGKWIDLESKEDKKVYKELKTKKKIERENKKKLKQNKITTAKKKSKKQN
jgi:Protein of unknown function (DUF1064)